MCIDCKAGESSSKKSSSCYACPAGTYSLSGSKCIPCPAGYYSYSGSSTCKPCDAGTFSSEGASSCSYCPGGTYSKKGYLKCIHVKQEHTLEMDGLIVKFVKLGNTLKQNQINVIIVLEAHFPIEKHPNAHYVKMGLILKKDGLTVNYAMKENIH